MFISLSLNSHYDQLIVSLHQLDALLDVVTSVDTTELKPETLNHYFWVLSDLMSRAKTLCLELAIPAHL